MKKFKVVINGSLAKVFFMTLASAFLLATVILSPFGIYLLFKTFAETVEIHEL